MVEKKEQQSAGAYKGQLSKAKKEIEKLKKQVEDSQKVAHSHHKELDRLRAIISDKEIACELLEEEIKKYKDSRERESLGKLKLLETLINNEKPHPSNHDLCKFHNLLVDIVKWELP